MNAGGHAERTLAAAMAQHPPGRLADDERLYRLVCDADPKNARAFHLLGVVAHQLRRPDAASLVGRAVVLDPTFAEAHNDRGVILAANGLFKDALSCFERAIALNPGYLGARNNLGRGLRSIGRFDEALTQFELVLKSTPASPVAHFNLASVFGLIGRKSDAELALCMAELPALYEDESDIAERREAYAGRLARLCTDVESASTPVALADAIGSHQPFYLPYQGCNDRELQTLYGSLVCKIMAARYTTPALPNPPGPDEPIRLGIVSGFFRHHSNWKIPVKGWLKMLDRNRFHVSGYYTSAERDDETEAAAALCDRFAQGPLSLDAWRRKILDDAPHVLIFPEIGMDKVSAQLAAQRLAAVQCCSWGHPVTSGFPTIDYFLSSDLMEPAGAAAHYSEQLVRLPNLSIYYEPADLPPISIDRDELGLRPDAVVYWCCQSLPKYLPQFDGVFARIAAEVPDSQFTFIEFGGGMGVTQMFRARLERAFSAVGLNAGDYCIFLPRLTPDRFVAAIGQCDIVLDSIGWSGCNSILESLVHNVPIVTLAGEMMRGRHSAAILDMMDVRHTTARTIDEYVSIAGFLGRTSAKRAELSAEIAKKKHRVYRDHACIAALEAFLDRVARNMDVNASSI